MTTHSIGLKSHIWRNNTRSVLLLGLYPVLLMGIFWLICLVLNMFMGCQNGPIINIEGTANLASTVTLHYAPLIIAGTAIWFTVAWFLHTGMIRKLAHSHPVTREEEPELYNLLENLCISRGITMPKLEIIETHARNAFASGISESTYSITVTRGLMNALTKEELEAVLGHELTHILNRDVRLLIITIIFTGLFGFLAQIVWSNLRYSLFFTSRRKDRNSGGFIIGMMLVAFILWLGYMASLLMRFALSRKREYMADAGSIELTKNPEAMMRALMRIAGRERLPGGADDIAMMCIENSKSFLGIFATHPSIENRLRAISEITNTPIPDVTSLPPIRKEESFSTTQKKNQPQSPLSHTRKNPWLTRTRRK